MISILFPLIVRPSSYPYSYNLLSCSIK